MERPEGELIQRSEPESMVSITVGRVMSTLLSSRPKNLQESISRLAPYSHKGSSGSVDESLWFLHKYVRDAAERDESMDDILVPIIQHTLRFKDTKQGSHAMILLNWLFQDEVLFQSITRNLSELIAKKEDKFLALGWCLVVRTLVDCEGNADQYPMNGIMEKHPMLVKIFSSCVPRLLLIVRRGSILQDGYDLPSRLSVSAADCLLSITEALAKGTEALTNGKKRSSLDESGRPVALIPNFSERRKKQTPGPKGANNQMTYILWNHLEELICLAQCLFAWNRKSRLLHAQGVNQVLKWLQEIQRHHCGSQDEAGSNILKGGSLLLSSCWKHYSVLLHLEDPKFSKRSKDLLEQYLSGIQYYSGNHPQGASDTKNATIETRKFFLNCLCLLYGRFEGKKFESIVAEYGPQLVPCLLSQLRCNNEDVTESVVAILKVAILKLHSPSGGSWSDTRHMDIMLPSLLHLLDERDGTAKAVVGLIAEYCSMSKDNHFFKEMLGRLVSGTHAQRMNAMDVISEVIRISKDLALIPSHIPWKEVANCLLECLGDEETYICQHTLELLNLIEHSLVLPGLVSRIYATNGEVQSTATKALIGILKHHKEDSDVICTLLDCLSNHHVLDTPETAGHSAEKLQKFEKLKSICTGRCHELTNNVSSMYFHVVASIGSKCNSDRVLKLIPEWAKNVQSWNSLIGPLLDKMFAEPSNAIIIRVLSCISEHLADASNLVLQHVLSRMKEQNETDKGFLSKSGIKSCSIKEAKWIEKSLFDRLCPLLILRLLPQRVFDDLDSSLMYGQVLNGDLVKVPDNQDIGFEDWQCVTALLLERAFSKLEFEEVRKLSAELCGRIHPQVLFPIVSFQLEESAGLQDMLKIKACLFSICTSLVVRGWESLLHPATSKIRELLERILLWPSDGDEVCKAQHGCIDCLALMICAELQPYETSKAAGAEIIRAEQKHETSGIAAMRSSVLAYVVGHLIQDRSECSPISKSDGKNVKVETSLPIPFRLCMANVLISACQKIPESAKNNFAQKAIPSLIYSLKVIPEPQIRAACIQVLFSATYHLKSALLPFSSDLLKLSLRFLEQGIEKEKLGGAKLMASLMASEDVILESLSVGLLEARSLLSKVSSSDPSADVREVCGKLLACITPQ